MDIAALLVEDDERLARFTTEYLTQSEVAVTRVADGREVVPALEKSSVDIIILDLMLPGLDGFGVCRAVRARWSTPIIAVTARAEEADRVLGLELGADDYVVKPYSPRELLARIRAQVRRARGEAGPSRTLRVGPLELDLTAMQASLRGAPLQLTSYEFTLLRILAERRGRVLSREQLLELAKGSAEESFDRSIDVRISRLRQKLGEDPRQPALLRTVRGLGYLLAEGAAAAEEV